MDKDLTEFKNYCDDFKKSKVLKLFKDLKITKDDLKNDNDQEYENDIKDYSKIDEKRFKDVVLFLPVDDQQNKTDILNAQDKLEEHTKPKEQSFVPNNVEDPLQKARLMSFK